MYLIITNFWFIPSFPSGNHKAIYFLCPHNTYIFLFPKGGMGLQISWETCSWLPKEQVVKSSVLSTVQFNSVQSPSRVRLFATAWTAARQASLSINNSRSSPKLVCQVSDAIQPPHPLPSPSPPVPNPSQHQGLFQWVSSSHEVAKVLEFQL